MRKLDKSRPYGQVFGGVGVAYEQDGMLFDSRGNEIGSQVTTHGAAETDPAPGKVGESPAELEARLRAEIEAKVRAELAGASPAKPGVTKGVRKPRAAKVEEAPASNTPPPAEPTASASDSQLDAQLQS